MGEQRYEPTNEQLAGLQPPSYPTPHQSAAQAYQSRQLAAYQSAPPPPSSRGASATIVIMVVIFIFVALSVVGALVAIGLFSAR